MKTYLEEIIKVRKAFSANRASNPSLKYICIEEFVLQNGREYTTQAKKKFRHGRLGQCYKNAYHLADSNPELIYVEGYASTKMLGFPFAHAWCVDRDGLIYDPTWKDGDKYYGVEFSLSYVTQVILKRRCYGVIDNWENHWPLLNGEDIAFREEVKNELR